MRLEDLTLVFDVDGTLIGGESADWNSFNEAIERVAGFYPQPEFYESLIEVNARAIVQKALAEHSESERSAKEDEIAAQYASNLAAVGQEHPEAFMASPGVIELLADLGSRQITHAIATGDFYDSIITKLRLAQVPYEGIPLVTSSDYGIRAEIIKAAIGKANGELPKSLYIGDGTWDLRATQALGIPFIGFGRNREKLKLNGALYLLDSFHPEHFWEVIESVVENEF